MPKPELEAATQSRFGEAKPETSTTTSTPLKLTAEPTTMAKPEPDALTKPRFVEAKSTDTDVAAEPLQEREQSQPSNPAGPAKFAPSAIFMHGDSTKAQSDTRPPRSSDLAAQSEPQSLTKPRSVEAKPTDTNTDTGLLHEREAAQPSNPAGPAKFAPSAISMHDDSTKAQSDTRPPRPSDNSESHTDAATSFTSSGIAGVSGIGATKHDEPTSAAGITSPKHETSTTNTNIIDPNTIDSNTIDRNTVDTTATPPSSIGLASGISTSDKNSSVSRIAHTQNEPTTTTHTATPAQHEATSTQSLTSPSTNDTPSSTTDRPTTQQKTSTTSAASKPTDGNADESIKLTGPGPRPLEDLAREHGGDAGALSSETAKEQGVKGGLLGDEESAGAGAGVSHATATAGDVETDRRDSAKSLGDEEKAGGAQKGGSGEEYIKSSGLAADGGDFDAARAGAGREADREFLPLVFANVSPEC